MSKEKDPWWNTVDGQKAMFFGMTKDQYLSELKPVNTKQAGDYGADPLGEGKFRMVPSGDIVDHAERNRRLKRNPLKDSDPLVIIGRLVAIGYHDGHSERKIGFSAKNLLAWKGPKKGGDLVIVTDLGKLPDPVPGRSPVYKNFHGCDPSMLREVDWTPPRADRVTILGLAVWVQYRIPAPMRDSNKEGSDWVHHFGDFGGGDWRKENKYKPHFMRDSSGNFYLDRRAGNAYFLDQWIEG